MNALVSSAASVTVSERGSEDVRVARSLVDGPDRKPLVFVTLSSPPRNGISFPALNWNQSHLGTQSPVAV